MTPIEFKERFIATIPAGIPADLSAELAEFVSFDAVQVAELGLPAEDNRLLVEAGLPRNSAPFLAFGGPKVELLGPVEDHPHVRAIGLTGFGDPIGIDTNDSGAVVLLSQSSGERKVMNRTIVGLAHCLCSFAELRAGRDADQVRAEIASIEVGLGQPDSWWMTEIAARN